MAARAISTARFLDVMGSAFVCTMPGSAAVCRQTRKASFFDGA
jgi:hypothetical protein